MTKTVPKVDSMDNQNQDKRYTLAEIVAEHSSLPVGTAFLGMHGIHLELPGSQPDLVYIDNPSEPTVRLFTRWDDDSYRLDHAERNLFRMRKLAEHARRSLDRVGRKEEHGR